MPRPHSAQGLRPGGGSPIATAAVERIAALYQIEAEIRGHPADERRQVRQARAKPLMEEMQKWLKNSLSLLSPKSETAAAIRYALSRWRALTRYIDDGRAAPLNCSAWPRLCKLYPEPDNLFCTYPAG